MAYKSLQRITRERERESGLYGWRDIWLLVADSVAASFDTTSTVRDDGGLPLLIAQWRDHAAIASTYIVERPHADHLPLSVYRALFDAHTARRPHTLRPDCRSVTQPENS